MSPRIIQHYGCDNYSVVPPFDNRKKSNIKDTAITALLLRTGCRGRQPLQFRICTNSEQRANAVRPYGGSGKFVVPQNRYALCGFAFDCGEGRRCRFCHSDMTLCLSFTLVSYAHSSFLTYPAFSIFLFFQNEYILSSEK